MRPWDDWPRAAAPIPGKGIQAHSKRGAFVEHWWAQRWIQALERVTDAGRLRRGQSYARKGQVLSIDEKGGVVSARVQGSRPTPYKVTIRLAPFGDAEWQAVIDGLSARALFSAQLLSGEMPLEIEEAFSAAGLSLFPNRSDDLVTNCTCPDWANPCKHVAATHYILGEQFDEDPFLLFRLRGRREEQIIAALRAQRAAADPAADPAADALGDRAADPAAGAAADALGDHAADPAADALGDRAADPAGDPAQKTARKTARGAAPDPAPQGADRVLAEQPAAYAAFDGPLEESLADFWELGASLDHFPTSIRAPSAPLAVLRRLGPPSFVDQDLEQLLGPLYAEAARRALAMAACDEATPQATEQEDAEL